MQKNWLKIWEVVQSSTFYIMSYGNYFTKKEYKKRFQNKKDLILTETHWNSF